MNRVYCSLKEESIFKDVVYARFHMLSQLEFRSAASNAEQLELHGDELFSETPLAHS